MTKILTREELTHGLAWTKENAFRGKVHVDPDKLQALYAMALALLDVDDLEPSTAQSPEQVVEAVRIGRCDYDRLVAIESLVHGEGDVVERVRRMVGENERWRATYDGDHYCDKLRRAEANLSAQGINLHNALEAWKAERTRALRAEAELAECTRELERQLAEADEGTRITKTTSHEIIEAQSHRLAELERQLADAKAAVKEILEARQRDGRDIGVLSTQLVEVKALARYWINEARFSADHEGFVGTVDEADAALVALDAEPTPKPAKPYRLDYAAASGPCGGCSGMYLEGSEVAVMTHGDASVMHVRCAERLALDAPPSDSEECESCGGTGRDGGSSAPCPECVRRSSDSEDKV